MADAILVLNAGSSSLKFAVFVAGEPPEPLLRGQLEGLFTQPHFVARDHADSVIGEQKWAAGTKLGHDGAIEFLFAWGQGDVLRNHRIVAAGHRVVHGGLKFTHPVRIDPEVLTALEAFVPLAPLHQPHNLAAIRAIVERLPQLPQVACFDTSFHRTQPAVAQAFALPRRYTEEGVLRYGFHGLSYEYIASVCPATDARAAAGRTVVAHLGNGASMCALKGGQSVASTMSFTAVDGLPMGTRCGSLDPGVLLYLMDHHGMDARALEKLIYQQSGLLGVSGISSDMRTLLASQDPRGGGGDRSVRLPSRPRAGLAGGCPGRARRAGIHRRHRRERRSHPCPCLPRRRLARTGAGRGGQRRRRPAHQPPSRAASPSGSSPRMRS